MGLFITLILGLFILIGALISFFSEQNKKFINFSVGLAFSVITLLVILELIPHTLETLNEVNSSINSVFILILFSLAGIVLLKIFDKLIPDHDTDDEHNLEHIGLLTSIALVLHNIIEGMAVCNITNVSFSSGLLISIGVGLHNIPLGMIVASTIYEGNKDKKKTSIIVVLISLSTFLGGLLMMFVQDYFTISFQGIILSITLGMLVFISLFELLPKIIKIKDKSSVAKGMLLGIVMISLALIFHHH